MSVFEMKGGPINRRYLDRKSKPDLITMYMTLLDAHCRAQDLAAEREIKQPGVDVIIRMNTEYNRVYRRTRNGGKAMRAAIDEWIAALTTHAARQEKESGG